MSSVVLPRVRLVAFSAFRAGSLLSVLLRSSEHSPSSRVLVCSFGELSRAQAFARRWAVRLGVSVPVRPGFPASWPETFRQWWQVSIPVDFPSTRLPERGLVPAAGGLRRFALRLAACGFAHRRFPVALGGEVSRV